MNDLTFDEIREQIDARIIALETERDTEARKLINMRRRIDPSRVDLKPFVHILDKIRAEQALLAALEGAVKEYELRQAAYQREAAALAPEYARLQRERRCRSVVEAASATNATPGMLASLHEVADQSEFLELSIQARQSIRDIEAYQAQVARTVRKFRRQQQDANE